MTCQDCGQEAGTGKIVCRDCHRRRINPEYQAATVTPASPPPGNFRANRERGSNEYQ